MKKINKDAEVRVIQAPSRAIVPQLSNISSAYTHNEYVILDFGFIAPTYDQESDLFENTQIARICLTWDSIEELSDMLVSVLKDKQKSGKKRRNKSDNVKG